ncbi:MAG: hypothetical protein WBB82_06965 [Limnothrix sp.]
MSIQNHPFEELFEQYPKLRQFSDSSPHNSEILKQYQEILSKPCFKSIKGIKEKLNNVASEGKLSSTLAELRIAEKLADRGFQIQLISDEDPRWSKSPPDLTLIHSDFEAFVQITRWESGETHATNLFHQKTELIAKEYNVVLKFHCLPSKFSSLAVGHQERTEKENLVEKHKEKLSKLIQNIDRRMLPQSISIDGIDCRIENAEQGKGRVEIERTDFSRVPEEDFEKQILDRINKKANNPGEWSPSQQKVPYFIALDIEQEIGQYDILSRVLYGASTYDDFKYPSIVNELFNNISWREFLLKLGYDEGRYNSNSYIHPNNIGCFLESSKVCGMITLHRDSLAYFPNPFVATNLLRSDYHQLLKIPIAPL